MESLHGADLVCIDMSDIKTMYQNLRDKVSKAHMGTITSIKIKWFSMLEQ